MEINKRERKLLDEFKELFDVETLSRKQVDKILKRNVTDKEWKNYNKDYKSIFSQIAKQAAKVGKKKLRKKIIVKPPQQEIERIRAERAQRRQQEDEYHRMNILFEQAQEPYRIERVNLEEYPRFTATQSAWRILGNVDLFNVNEAITTLVNRVLSGTNPNSRVQFQLRIEGSDQQPITRLMHAEDAAELLSEWTIAFMEYHAVDINNITFKVLEIRLPNGGTLTHRNEIIKSDKSRCITQIINDDTLCLVRSIIACLGIYDKEKLGEIFKNKLLEKEIDEINYKRRNANYTQIHKGIFSNNEIKYLSQTAKKLQTVLANAFHRIYKIPIREYGNDLYDAQDIANKIEIQINIYSLDRELIFTTTPNDDGNTKVHLLLSNNESPHFDAITKISAFEPKIQQKACKWCNAKTECIKTKIVKCETCFKYYQNQECYDNHKANKRCIEHSFSCQKCEKLITKRTKEEHKCGEYECKSCNQFVVRPHECYMSRKSLKNTSEKYIFFDFETTLDENNKHIVNYGIAQYFNGYEHIFDNIDEFCDWAFDKKHHNYTLIAHNGKGYDFQFILEWLVKHGIKPSLICNGNKIMQLEVKKGYSIRLIDSLLFTLMPLRNFPKTFGLTELKKGYFPYKFNTIQNQNYVGKYPEKEYYGHDEMKKADKKNLMNGITQ